MIWKERNFYKIATSIQLHRTHAQFGRGTEICPRHMDYPRAYDPSRRIAGSGYEIGRGHDQEDPGNEVASAQILIIL